MAPLIPHGFINPELNLFFAFVIGLGFGYVLEQAGFSSSRKLAGVFYGYDFVVLRVFFTAGITALTGLITMSYLGWVDWSSLYVNPTFLWAAIVGGAIMGFGFILGGFCPGTSMVGAVIGRIDAIVFVGGMMIGIFLFGEFFSVFKPIYLGYYFGEIYVYETLGIGRNWFALMLIVMALVAFGITRIIEDKINKINPKELAMRPSYLIPVIAILVLGLVNVILPEEKPAKLGEPTPAEIAEAFNKPERLIMPDEVAFQIIKNKSDLILVDVRNAEQYNAFHLPGAISVPMDEILSPAWKRFFKQQDKRLVFYSNSQSIADQAWFLAQREGLENVFVLEGGLNHLFETVFKQQELSSNANEQMQYRHRFLQQAREFFITGGAFREEARPAVPVKKIIEIQAPAGGGGC